MVITASRQQLPQGLVTNRQVMGDEDAVDDRPRPQDEIEGGEAGEEGDRHHEAGGAPDAELADQVQGPAGPDQVGDEVAFEPARALAEPVADAGIGFFPGGGIEGFGAVAVHVEAHAEVAVLGDVEGVPAAEGAEFGGAEVVRGAAEGDGDAQADEAAEVAAEPDVVFDGEPAREEVLRVVVVGELGLQADHIGARGGEGGDGLFELVGVGAVFGVEDDEEIAAGAHQAVVAGARFGLGLGLRDDDDFGPGRDAGGLQRCEGFRVVGLEQEFDVEFVARVVDLREGGEDVARDVAFLVERDQDGVERPAAFRFLGHGGAPAMFAAEEDGEEAEADGEEIDHAEQRGDHAEADQVVAHQQVEDGDEGAAEGGFLAGGNAAGADGDAAGAGEDGGDGDADEAGAEVAEVVVDDHQQGGDVLIGDGGGERGDRAAEVRADGGAEDRGDHADDDPHPRDGGPGAGGAVGIDVLAHQGIAAVDRGDADDGAGVGIRRGFFRRSADRCGGRFCRRGGRRGDRGGGNGGGLRGRGRRGHGGAGRGHGLIIGDRGYDDLNGGGFRLGFQDRFRFGFRCRFRFRIVEAGHGDDFGASDLDDLVGNIEDRGGGGIGGDAGGERGGGDRGGRDRRGEARRSGFVEDRIGGEIDDMLDRFRFRFIDRVGIEAGGEDGERGGWRRAGGVRRVVLQGRGQIRGGVVGLAVRWRLRWHGLLGNIPVGGRCVAWSGRGWRYGV